MSALIRYQMLFVRKTKTSHGIVVVLQNMSMNVSLLITLQTKHNEHVPGEWIWEHTNTTVKWFDWAPDEPNDYHRQQCLAYIRYMYPTVIGWVSKKAH